MPQVVRVAVTGAAGRVSSSLIVRLASGEVFGPKARWCFNSWNCPPPSRRGGDEEPRREPCTSCSDCGFSTLKDVIITDDPNRAFTGATAHSSWGRRRGPGKQRKDLIRKNGRSSSARAAIAKNAASDVRVWSSATRATRTAHRLPQRARRARPIAGTR